MTSNQKNTIALQVNQEEVITSSDSDCKKDIGSLRSRCDLYYLYIFYSKLTMITYYS